MKLCEIVVEVHHTPKAITGKTGAASRRAPCAAARTASRPGCPAARNTRRRGSRMLCEAMPEPLVFEVQQSADGRVVGSAAHARDPRVHGISVRILGLFVALADPGGEWPAQESDDFCGSGDLFQIVPFIAGHLRVSPRLEVEAAAHRDRKSTRLNSS